MSKARDRILAALEKFQPKAIEVPELGGTVYVRPLSVAGMGRIHRQMQEAGEAAKSAKAEAAARPDDAELAAKAARAAADHEAAKDSASVTMLADCLVDEHGERLFTGEDARILANLPGMICEKLLRHIEDTFAQESSGTMGAAGN